MALSGSCFEDISNAVTATTLQPDGIGTMYENPQSLSLDESLLDEALKLFEDFAVGWFGSYDDLFNVNNEAVAPCNERVFEPYMRTRSHHLSMTSRCLMKLPSCSMILLLDSLLLTMICSRLCKVKMIGEVGKIMHEETIFHGIELLLNVNRSCM